MNGDKGNNKRYGFILGMLFMICEKIAEFFTAGLIFRLFTSHSKVENAYEASATVGICRIIRKKTRKFFAWIKHAVARQFEGSMMIRLISSALVRLLNTSARVIGAFSMTWSAYAVLIAVIKRYVLLDTEGTSSSLLCGLIVFIASVPLLFSDRSVITLSSESPIISSVLTHVVGVPDETLRPGRSARSAQSSAVILGIGLGMLTYVIPPLWFLIGFASLVLISLVMIYPESGVVVSIAAAPLLGVTSMPSIALAGLVLLTAFAYLIKVIRGKRVFKFGITELAVYAFMAAVLLGGFAPGESNTLENALLSFSLMLIFPLAVNLMKYKHWIKTCAIAFAVPAAFVAFFGIAQYALGMAPYGWIDEELFSGIASRSTSVFNNPNILGAYLVMIFPLSLMFTLPKYSSRVRALGGLVSAFIAVCTVFTFSRSAWIALVFGGILFVTLIDPKGILWTVPVAGVVALGAIIFPETIGARILNFATLADSANSYRVSVWNSSWDMFFNVIGGGVGMGEEAFKTAYVNFAETGTHSVMHSHSLLLQIGIQLGIVGVLLFAVAVISVSGKCATSVMGKSSDKELSAIVKASVSGAMALLAAGIFDYTWYNFRIMFIFWALLGLACAAVNIGEREHERIAVADYDEMSAYMTVAIPRASENNKKREGNEK